MGIRRLLPAVLLLASLTPIAVARDAGFHGSLGATPLNQPIVGMAATPSGDGYWLVAADGGVFTFGDARFFGSAADLPLRAPIVGMVATATGEGYLLAAGDGGVFAYGDASGFGSLGWHKPVTAIVPSPSRAGFWLVTEDGDTFSHGDATYGIRAHADDVVGAAGRSAGGFWVVTATGVVHGVGGAASLGDLSGKPPAQPIVDMAATPSGRGYWLVGRDGGIFSFGDAVFFGSTGAMRLNRPIVGMASSPDRGYWFVASDGGVFTFSPSSAPAASSCTIFPADNPWNTDVSRYPVHARSAAWVSSIGGGNLHPDFGTPYGIPFGEVPAGQPGVRVTFDYDDESDHALYPIPPGAPVENGSDAHVLVVSRSECRLYELFAAARQGDGSWHAGSGAIFDLRSNALRPDGWTSADAAGLPIFPGLVRYDEVAAGHIDHAIRFTVSETQRGYIHPATHFASSNTDPNVPPMGARFRMKASYDCSWASREVQVICAAMKRYGMFVADNGSDWYVTGAPDPRWDDEALEDVKSIPGDAFEAVETGAVNT